MKPVSKRIPLFPLSLITLALCGYARADDQAQTLSAITVKGERTSATHRVTVKNMDETTATDMKEVLFNEPSVSFGGGNGTSQWLTIRGMGQDQIDVKVDNTYSDTQIFHHNGRFLFDPALVKVVAVQKGTGSASAGIGATSGAIVAKTVDAADLLRPGQNVGFKLNAGVSSNKGWSHGASVYGKWNGLDALVSANWVHESNYKPGKGYAPADGSSRIHNSELGQRGLLAKLAYNFNGSQRFVLSHRQEKTYGLRALREEFDFGQDYMPNPSRGFDASCVGCYAGSDGYARDANGNKILYTSNNQPRYRILTQDTTNAEYENGDLGVLGSLKSNLYLQNIKRKENDGGSYSTNRLRTVGANIGFDTPLMSRHTVKYGINWRHQESMPGSRANFRTRRIADTVNEKKTDVGVYAEGIWDFAPVTLTTGLRYDRFSANFSDGKKFSGSKVNPSIGAIYEVTPDLSFNASLNYASRSPRLTEVFLSGGTVYSAASDLKAEHSRNAEIGFKYKWQDLALEGSLFSQRIKDLQAVSNNVYYNGGSLKNKGYELSVSYRWNGLTARAGVAYNDPKTNGVNVDDLVTAVPIGRTWTAGLSYRFANPNLELGWRGRFVQSSDYVVVSTRGAGGLTNTNRPGYGVNDIYLNWKPTGRDDWNVNFAVNNVGNKLYKPHSQRESTNGNSLPEAGRDFRLGVNYHF